LTPNVPNLRFLGEFLASIRVEYGKVKILDQPVQKINEKHSNLLILSAREDKRSFLIEGLMFLIQHL
jgi:hypothetical protein